VPSTGCPGALVTISGSEFTGATLVEFNGISASFTVINDTVIEATVPASASTGVITVTNAAGCNASSTLAFVVTTCGGGASVNLKLFLQGYYAGSGSMYPVLLFQAVAGATGLETDTVYVELHDVIDPTIVVDVTTALILTDGTGTASFTTASAGTYWVVIKHRNTVQTWTANPVAIPATIDFTTAAANAFGGNQVDVLGEGIFSMYTGDINQDEYIDIFDFPDFDVDNQNFVSGVYVATDMNGDGYVDIFDFPVFDLNNQNFIFSIHP
jgi:hypothetical protein